MSLDQNKYFLQNTAFFKNKLKWLKIQIKKRDTVMETFFYPKSKHFVLRWLKSSDSDAVPFGHW